MSNTFLYFAMIIKSPPVGLFRARAVSLTTNFISARCASNVVNLSFIVLNRYYLFSYFCVIFYLLFLVVKCSFYNYYCIYADLYLSYVHTYGCVVFVNVSFYNILLNSLALLPTLPV